MGVIAYNGSCPNFRSLLTEAAAEIGAVVIGFDDPRLVEVDLLLVEDSTDDFPGTVHELRWFGVPILLVTDGEGHVPFGGVDGVLLLDMPVELLIESLADALAV